MSAPVDEFKLKTKTWFDFELMATTKLPAGETVRRLKLVPLAKGEPEISVAELWLTW